jgi:hypothetical protein
MYLAGLSSVFSMTLAASFAGLSLMVGLQQA